VQINCNFVCQVATLNETENSCKIQSERTFHGKLVWKKWEWRAKKVVRIQKSEKCSEFLLLVLVYVCVYMYVS